MRYNCKDRQGNVIKEFSCEVAEGCSSIIMGMTHQCDDITIVSEGGNNGGRAQAVSAPSPSANAAQEASAEGPIVD